tara:strand:- start:35 stop:433 length:399 start_codon:yes stop_codon:yes gene_type:complete
MKILSFFLLALTFSNLTWATVEYGTLDVAGGNTSLVLNQGDVFEVTNFENKFAPTGGGMYIINFTAPDGSVRSMNFAMFRNSNKNDILALPSPDNMVLYGPTTITLGTVDWIMYKLTRAPNPQPAAAATTEN